MTIKEQLQKEYKEYLKDCRESRYPYEGTFIQWLEQTT